MPGRLHKARWAAVFLLPLAGIVGWWWLWDEPVPTPTPAATTPRAEPPVAEPAARPVEARGAVRVGEVQVSGGRVHNAQLVAARMQARFQRCYGRLLATRPDARGSLLLDVTVGAKGEVSAVEGTSDALAPMTACLHEAVKATVFAAPEGGAARISIPVTFTSRG